MEKSSSMEGVKGKTVERVAMEDMFSIRRASMADSWTVGILYSWDWGLERIYCGGEAEAQTRGRIEIRRPVGRSIVLIENRGAREAQRGKVNMIAERGGLYIERSFMSIRPTKALAHT